MSVLEARVEAVVPPADVRIASSQELVQSMLSTITPPTPTARSGQS